MRRSGGYGLAAVALLLLTTGMARAAESIKWVKSFAEAQAEAKKTHKLIMLDFFTEW